MKTPLQGISPKDRRLARTSLKILRNVTPSQAAQEPVYIRIGEDGSEMQLPPAAVESFQEVLQNLAQGNRVEIFSVTQELTTQQAADYLNVSRPFVVKLLEAGQIPYTKTGKHRRVKLADLKKYDTERNREADRNLKALAKQAQELDFGY